MIAARFIENETGVEVSVDGVFSWDSPDRRTMVVTYPSGRRYAIGPDDFAKHFTIVSPQEVFITAIAMDDRPTPKQREVP